MHPVTPAHFQVYWPRWARDSRSLYFVDVDYTAYRVSVDTGSTEKVAEDSQGVEDCGDHLLVVYRDSAGQRFALRDASGHERDVLHLAGCTVDSPPHCNRAGTQAVFAYSSCTWDLQPPSDVAVIELASGAVTNLTHDPEARSSSPSFTPDGASIVFSSRRSGNINLWEMTSAGTRPRQLTFGDEFDEEPDVSPDGKTVVFITSITSAPLFSQTAGGERHKMRADLDDTLFPQVTPDGDEIVFASRLRGVERIIARSLATGEDRVVAVGETPALTADGREVLYATADPPQLFAQPLHGGSPRLLARLPGPVDMITAGPDGYAHVRVARERSEAWRVPIAGGEPSVIWTCHGAASRQRHGVGGRSRRNAPAMSSTSSRRAHDRRWTRRPSSTRTGTPGIAAASRSCTGTAAKSGVTTRVGATNACSTRHTRTDSRRLPTARRSITATSSRTRAGGCSRTLASAPACAEDRLPARGYLTVFSLRISRLVAFS